MDKDLIARLGEIPEDVATEMILKVLPDVPPLREVVAFSVLHILAIPLHIILALTIIFSNYIHRHPTSWMFFLSMAASSICYTLLTFAGELQNKHPSDGLRIASAALSIVAPLMQGGTLLALTVKIWAVLAELLAPSYVKVFARIITWDPFLLSYTWLIVIPIFIYSCIVANADPIYVQRYYFYCTIFPGHNDIHVSAMLVVMIELALCVFFAIWAFYLFFSVKKSARRRLQDINSDLIFRVMLYMVWIVMTLVVAIIEYHSRTIHKALAIMIATDSLSSFIIFATQREMLRVWGLDSLSKYFNCTTSSEFQGSSDLQSSRSRSRGGEAELSNMEGRKEFSKLSSVDDIEFESDVKIKREYEKDGESDDDMGAHVVHKGDYPSHLSPVAETYSATAPSPVSQYTHNSPFSQYFPTPTTVVSPPANTHTHVRQNSKGEVPTRKPVPSFASYELPAITLASTSPTSMNSYRDSVSREGTPRTVEMNWSKRKSQQQPQQAWNNSQTSHSSYSHPYQNYEGRR